MEVIVMVFRTHHSQKWHISSQHVSAYTCGARLRSVDYRGKTEEMRYADVSPDDVCVNCARYAHPFDWCK